MTTLMAQGPLDRRVGRLAELRAIAEKRRQAKALHDCALTLGTIPGRERDANNVSKEAEIADAEVKQMLASMTANVALSGGAQEQGRSADSAPSARTKG